MKLIFSLFLLLALARPSLQEPKKNKQGKKQRKFKITGSNIAQFDDYASVNVDISDPDFLAQFQGPSEEEDPACCSEPIMINRGRSGLPGAAGLMGPEGQRGPQGIPGRRGIQGVMGGAGS